MELTTNSQKYLDFKSYLNDTTFQKNAQTTYSVSAQFNGKQYQNLP